MRIKARLASTVVAWLLENPGDRDEFHRVLHLVCADEPMLLEHSFPLHDPSLPYMQRYFRFGPKYIGVFQWDQHARSIRVHRVREPGERPRAA